MDLRIFIDADACPVRDETYRVAERHGVPVTIVANSFLRVPRHEMFTLVIVSDGFDAADDYIADLAGEKTVVITADILLADRCLKSGAKVIGPNGKSFTENSIGGAIATRAIMADLRAGAEMPNKGGPPPFEAKDRSRFLSTLHEVLEALKRGQ